ncbi:MAG: hypothetical protein JOZ99_10295 [Actinobacteria bacterium]|nr:hypothetical protein [Actinomycetota bacterium]
MITNAALSPPRDAQRRRVYLAETPLGGRRLPLLADCAHFADQVVGSLWWQARFPAHDLAGVPRLRPGQGARHAFFRIDPDGPTITLPRRYRTTGVVLHELCHWALADDDDLPNHGRTFARLLLDATNEFGGGSRGDALAANYAAHRVHVGRPPRTGPDGRLRYGWDERLRLGRGRVLAVHHRAAGGEPVCTSGRFEGWGRNGSTVRIRVAHELLTLPAADVWDVRAVRAEAEIREARGVPLDGVTTAASVPQEAAHR